MSAPDASKFQTCATRALGNRVEVNHNGWLMDFIYGPDGKLLDEYQIGGGYTGWAIGYQYLGSRLVAQYSQGTTFFVHSDILGSTHVVTNMSGAVADSYDYMPFGEQLRGSSTTPAKLAGMYDDSESNLYHTLFRQYPAFQGRWLSPDPGSMGASLDDPQSWNAYAYADNSPLTNIDPQGSDFYSIGSCTYFRQYYKAGTDPLAPWQGYDDFFVGCSTDNGQVAGGGNGGGTGGGGGAGGGSGNGQGLFGKLIGKVCSIVPEGKSIGISNAYGGIGAFGGSAEMVVNYSTGQVSGFTAGSFQLGWNGAVSLTASTSYLYGNLKGDNSGYSGGFTTLAGSVPLADASVGGFISRSSGGLNSPVPTPNGVTAVGATVGLAFLGRFGGGAGASHYSQPMQLGKYWGFSLADWAAFAAKNTVCK